jgi:L-ascorbate metabolism protein UlaG (beta-lactamase superfamily)
MKITKYGHACLLVSNDIGEHIIIDPGCFTKLPSDLAGISAIIITEEHVDHLDISNIKMILSANPQALIYTSSGASKLLTQNSIVSETIEGQIEKSIGKFKISFYENDHAISYGSSPCKSLAIKINDDIYYPSDTYNVIEEKVKILALPTSGPWHKVSDAVDFANNINSEKILATHNGLYNSDGNQVTNHFIKMNLVDQKREYIFLEDGETTNL